MSTSSADLEREWSRLEAFSDAFTCYSSAIAAWAAAQRSDWLALTDPGLGLTVADAADGLFAFGHLTPGLRRELALQRVGADTPDQAVAQVLEELARSGRVLIAGDGFYQPWHVARGRRHVPHWFVLTRDADGLTVCDPFSFRSELGLQTPYRGPVTETELPTLLRALPDENPVYRLRETLAFGDAGDPPEHTLYAWFVHADADATVPLAGETGPDAIRRLAAHFREHGQDPLAYRQAEDIWAIGRHRALLVRHTRERAGGHSDDALDQWLHEHAEPLAKRWGHVAPLIMQATLTLSAGRNASGSLAETLEDLAVREEVAAGACPVGSALTKL